MGAAYRRETESYEPKWHPGIYFEGTPVDAEVAVYDAALEYFVPGQTDTSAGIGQVWRFRNANQVSNGSALEWTIGAQYNAPTEWVGAQITGAQYDIVTVPAGVYMFTSIDTDNSHNIDFGLAGTLGDQHRFYFALENWTGGSKVGTQDVARFYHTATQHNSTFAANIDNINFIFVVGESKFGGEGGIPSDPGSFKVLFHYENGGGNTPELSQAAEWDLLKIA